METNPLEPELFHPRQFLLRLAAGLVGARDAEDLVQEVWIRALAADGPRPAHARGWLARIARNLAITRFRRERRRTRLERDARGRARTGPTPPRTWPRRAPASS